MTKESHQDLSFSISVDRYLSNSSCLIVCRELRTRTVVSTGTDEGVGDKRTLGSWTCKIRHLKSVTSSVHLALFRSYPQQTADSGSSKVLYLYSIIGPSEKSC